MHIGKHRKNSEAAWGTACGQALRHEETHLRDMEHIEIKDGCRQILNLLGHLWEELHTDVIVADQKLEIRLY